VPALNIAMQLSCLRQPLRKALHTAAELGATAVEIDARHELQPASLSDTGLRELRNLLNDLNLRVAAIAFPTQRGYDVLDELDRRVTATKAAMKMAYDLGARVTINQVGRLPEKSEGPAWDTLVQVLTDLGTYGHHVGSWLAAQSGAESGPDLQRLIAALPDGALGVDLDPGALIVNGFSPLETIGAVGRSILHVHARDGVRDLARKRGLEVPLGRGSADFPAILGALEEVGYRGYFTVARDQSDDPPYELGAAVKYLKNI
jgi:sugar phosphate isomerase/epimerase